MTQYGYRLFAVELHHGMRHQVHPLGAAELPLDEDAKSGESSGKRVIDYREVLVKDIENKKGEAQKFRTTEESDDGTSAVESQGMAMRFTDASFEETSSRMYFEFGLRNLDGTLIFDDPAVDDIELKGKPTLYPYRATLVANKDSKRGLLAVEARGRSCPVDAVIRGLHAVSPDGWRLRILAHVAGEAAMTDFIRRAKVGVVQFERFTHDDDGAPNRHDVKMSIVTRDSGDSIKDRVLEWATTYFGFAKDYLIDDEIENANNVENEDRPKKARLSREERTKLRRQESDRKKIEKAHAKAAAIEFRTSQGRAAAETMKSDIFANRVEDVDIEFDNVGVELDDGFTKKILKPTSDFRRHTYVIGRGVVSNDRFFQAAEATASNLLGLVQRTKLRADR